MVFVIISLDFKRCGFYVSKTLEDNTLKNNKFQREAIGLNSSHVLISQLETLDEATEVL